MNIIVVRHAERSRSGPDDPLTSEGMAAAEATGRWLRERAISVDAVFSTPTRRTAQTADGLLRGLGAQDVPVTTRASMPRDAWGWDKLIDELRASGVSDALLVVHHPTQRLVERAFGGETFAVPPTHRAAAFVVAEDAEGWQCVAAWPGAPSGV